jgi:hypothetical protein
MSIFFAIPLKEIIKAVCTRLCSWIYIKKNTFRIIAPGTTTWL